MGCLGHGHRAGVTCQAGAGPMISCDGTEGSFEGTVAAGQEQGEQVGQPCEHKHRWTNEPSLGNGVIFFKGICEYFWWGLGALEN